VRSISCMMFCRREILSLYILRYQTLQIADLELIRLRGDAAQEFGCALRNTHKGNTGVRSTLGTACGTDEGYPCNRRRVWM
jgi:hypothetical protein